MSEATRRALGMLPLIFLLLGMGITAVCLSLWSRKKHRALPPRERRELGWEDVFTWKTSPFDTRQYFQNLSKELTIFARVLMVVVVLACSALGALTVLAILRVYGLF
jgi:hypothetical protein